jgi:hypothetical protein
MAKKLISMSVAFSSRPQDSKSWRDSYYHKLFGLKAAQEVERVLKIFERECPKDDRPRKAMEAIRAWAQGERKLRMADVRRLALDSHTAARDAKTNAAKFVAHAAGHAVATWHVPTHALGTFGYAGRAFVASKRKSRAPSPEPEERPPHADPLPRRSRGRKNAPQSNSA